MRALPHCWARLSSQGEASQRTHILSSFLTVHEWSQVGITIGDDAKESFHLNLFPLFGLKANKVGALMPIHPDHNAH